MSGYVRELESCAKILLSGSFRKLPSNIPVRVQEQLERRPEMMRSSAYAPYLYSSVDLLIDEAFGDGE